MKKTGKCIECSNCGEEFYAPKWRLDRAVKYCSRKCKKLAQRKSIPEFSKKLSPEKGYVLGVLGPGDGHVDKKRGGLSLKAKDEDFVHYFGNCLEKVYGLEVSYDLRPREPPREDQLRARLYSKNAVDDVLRYGSLKHFRHHSEKVPEEIKNARPEVKVPYLRGTFDSQGTICFGRGRKENTKFINLEVTKAHKKVVLELKDLLTSLGLSFRVAASARNNWAVHTQSADEVYNFYKEIGFTIARKQKKLERSLVFTLTKSPKGIYREISTEARRLKERGMTFREIGSELAVPQSVAYKAYRYAGGKKHVPLYEKVSSKASELRNKGLTYSEIASKLGVGQATAYRACQTTKKSS